ncbi:hypothetical protein QYM36_013795 [Artemia franciscana]|uniref:Uncharacterized protein n=1 Tax=Artemia franciscana TaxID=6661 RepID=A0AA88HJM7_ARTSF|nr:hypothetical protein QYM36_013795 [Artemia franciscana]
MFETTQAQLRMFYEGSIKKNDSIRRMNRPPSLRNDKFKTTSPRSRKCYFCGGSYSPNHACRAKGKTCTKCCKPNHLASVYRSNKVVNVVSGTTTALENSDHEDKIFLHEVSETNDKKEAIVSHTIKAQLPVSFKVDIGAQANFLPVKDFDMLSSKPEMTKAKQKLTSCRDGRIPFQGTCTVSCAYEQSRPSNQQLYIDGAIPKFYPVRKIPSALRGKLKAELDRMEKDYVIEKLTVPTEWVNSMVAVQHKDDTFRLCIDPVDLN